MKVEIVPKSGSDSSTAQKDIAYSYEIVSVSRTEIKLKFKFENPLKVSPQD